MNAWHNPKAMSQVPAIVPSAAAKLPVRPPQASALVPLDAESARRGALEADFEIRRGDAEARRSRGQVLAPLVDERPLARSFVLQPRRGYGEYARINEGDSRLAAQILGQPDNDGPRQADSRLLAQGSEAYRKAGAEPSLRPEPAQLVSLKV